MTIETTVSKHMNPHEFRRRKKELGISTEDLALIIGLTEMSVRNWINNRKPVPKWMALVFDALEARE